LATQALGETKQKQLSDERNLESIRKIAGYHVLNERVDVESLFQAGGIITVSGEIPIERSVSGGFFGVGGKEDGGVTVNQAKRTKEKENYDEACSTIDCVDIDDIRIPTTTINKTNINIIKC